MLLSLCFYIHDGTCDVPYARTYVTSSTQLLEITYSYWDGIGHRRVISVKKGTTIAKFLEQVKQQVQSQQFIACMPCYHVCVRMKWNTLWKLPNKYGNCLHISTYVAWCIFPFQKSHAVNFTFLCVFICSFIRSFVRACRSHRSSTTCAQWARRTYCMWRKI
jgi:hypothetical protein